MPQSLRTVVAAWMVASAAACAIPEIVSPREESLPALGTPPIRTDSAVYHLRTSPSFHELTIGVTYRNPTGSRVFIPACQGPTPPTLQKWEEGMWKTAYSPPVFACLGPPVVIQPHGIFTYSYRVVSARHDNVAPRFQVAQIPGTYRLIWGLHRTWNADRQPMGELLPLEYRISDTFQIQQQGMP